jgi:HEAT repeat protein
MPSLDEVRRELDKDELDYPALARDLGPDVLPELQALVAEDEPRIASKAAYLAGLIAGPSSHEVVSMAAGSRHDVVRIAAAATLHTLPVEQATGIAETLLSDPDVGVRARAVRSAAQLDEASLAERVRVIAAEDPHEELRDLASSLTEEAPS